MTELFSNPALTTDNSLAQLGFLYNPFEFLESSVDPHLPDYLVGNEVFSLASDDKPAYIGSPPGSGKTSARIAISRAYWAGHGGRPTFPLVYNLPDYIKFAPEDQPVSYEQHLVNILQAGAAGLLVNLAFRPEQFLALQQSDRRLAACLLQTHLPLPLDQFVSILEQTCDPNLLRPMLERTYPALDIPPAGLMAEFCQALAGCAAENAATSPEEQFWQLNQLLRGPLGSRNIFILLDSIDAFPTDTSEPVQQFDRLMRALVEKSDELAGQQIYLKWFIPDEALVPLNHLGIEESQFIKISWSLDQLTELIQKRIIAATEAQLGSMTAFAESGLTDVDRWIAGSVKPRPREVIRLTGHILHEYAAGHESYLTYELIEQSINWFKNN